MSDNNKKFSVDEIIAESKVEDRPGAEAESFGSEYYDNYDKEFSTEEIKFEPVETDSKKKKKRFFGKKEKESPDYDEKEDLYYGIQLKPFDELRKGFDSTGEIPNMDNTFAKLFDNTIPSLDDEVEKNFTRIQMERRRRVAEAVETAGIDVDDVANELGIVAPMPVTSFSADPYAKQHGIDIESGRADDDEDDFQRATMETAKGQTMEIKLNVLNDTIELQKNMNLPVVDDDTVNKIMESAETDESAVQEQENVPAAADVKLPHEPVDFQELEDVTKYREKGVPVHLLNIDILQSAILSEAAAYENGEAQEKKSKKPFSRFAHKQEPEYDVDSQESIDDYTSTADAKSIANELKGSSRKLSVRMLITGISALVLFIATLVCEGKGNAGTSIAYLIITGIFILLPLGFCFKNIINGIKSVLRFKADSDSAMAVASVLVLVQTIAAFLNVDKVSDGSIHVYGAVLAAMLFVNTLGKISMVKRIYGNFRFITAREQKYAVKTYDDYNTSLKLAKDSVAEAPSIVYQKKAGFLKRFLQLSYNPDPSESSSQAIAPLGLLLSLLLCIICIFITKDVAASITAMAAAAVVSVSFTNMLGLNMPISKLCNKARRAGAMVVGYDGIKSIAGTNAIMVDANDLFPEGTVVLDGVKTFGTDPEKAVYGATALIKEVGGILSNIFGQVINEYDSDLPRATGLTLEDENGISGKVDGKTILIGNRAILMNHGIEPPERDDVVKYTIGGKKAMFIAVDGKLEAMLVMSYRADKRKKIELQRLEQNGVSLIVRSTDVNITPKFLGNTFGISEASISVVYGNLGKVYSKLVDEEIPRADALVATKGRIESLMNVVSACVKEKKIINLIVAVQNIAVVLGFVLVAFLCCFSGMAQISSGALLMYELFWLVVVLVIPRIKIK